MIYNKEYERALDDVSTANSLTTPTHVSSESTYEAGYGNAMMGIHGTISYLRHQERTRHKNPLQRIAMWVFRI